MRSSRFLGIEKKELFSNKELVSFRDINMVDINIWGCRERLGSSTIFKKIDEPYAPS